MARLQVLSVEEISLKVLKKELTINASGSIVGNGWSNLELSLEGVEFYKDKVYNLNFTGNNSGKIDAEKDIDEVLREAKAELVIKNFPDDLIGVRIHAKENMLEEKLEKSGIIALISVFILLLMFYLSLKN